MILDTDETKWTGGATLIAYDPASKKPFLQERVSVEYPAFSIKNSNYIGFLDTRKVYWSFGLSNIEEFCDAILMLRYRMNLLSASEKPLDSFLMFEHKEDSPKFIPGSYGMLEGKYSLFELSSGDFNKLSDICVAKESMPFKFIASEESKLSDFQRCKKESSPFELNLKSGLSFMPANARSRQKISCSETRRLLSWILDQGSRHKLGTRREASYCPW